LLSPLCDQHAIEIALFLMLAVANGASRRDVSSWLREIVARLDFAVRTHGKYPCVFTDYRDLVDHPRERTDEYRKEATSGSILIPLLAAWAAALNDVDALKTLVNLQQSKLEHSTLQLWLPDNATEDQIFVGGREHGVALCDLPLSPTGKELLDTIAEACQKESSFRSLTSNTTGYWPLTLLACRHYRHPVPPQFWIDLLRPSTNDVSSEVAT
jgi:hypothetical protein